MNIRTAYERKPGRMDGPEPFPWDWQAWVGDWDEGDPIGSGSTEQAAIEDLMTRLEERADEQDAELLNGAAAACHSSSCRDASPPCSFTAGVMTGLTLWALLPADAAPMTDP